MHDAVDAHLNGEESVSRQIARLEVEQKRWRKEQRAKVREEKAAAKHKAKEAASEAQGEYLGKREPLTLSLRNLYGFLGKIMHAPRGRPQVW